MNVRKRSAARASCTLAGLTLFVACTPVLAQMKLMRDLDGDRVYEKAAIYAVSYEEALSAFAEAGGAPWDGTGKVLTFREVPGVSLSNPQSWDGFIAFLDAIYPSGETRANQLCDDTILGVLKWTCGAPLDCTPVTDCQGLFATSVLNTWKCIAGGDPPCPGAKPACRPTGVVPVIDSFTTTGGTACHCPQGAGGPCVINPAAVVDEFIFTGDVCRCETAEEPSKDLLAWRGACYNCYNYAANRKTVFFAQPKIPPDPPDPPPAVPFTCANVGDESGLVAADWPGPAAGPRPAGWPAGQCAAGQYLVALVVVPAAAGGWDYHWYRLNDNDRWTHKQGSTPATNLDAAGAVMGPGAANPPDMAALGDYAFCSYYCMPAPPAPMPGGFIDDGPWDPLTLAIGWLLDTSGIVSDRLRDLSDFFSDLLSHLPSGQAVPDPEWRNSEPFRGYGLMASEVAQGQGFPPFMRVFNGVVAFYSDIEGDENTVITYFADDGGLEDYLRSVLGPICGNNIREVGEQCDGTEDDACPGNCLSDCTCAPGKQIPTVSEWGMVVMALLIFTVATIVIVGRRRPAAA